MKKNKIFVACDSTSISKINVPKKRTIKWKMSKDLFKKLNNEKE